MKGDFVVKFLWIIREVSIAAGEFVDHMPAYKRHRSYRYDSFRFPGYGNRKALVGFRNLQKRGLIKDSGDDSFIFTGRGREWCSNSVRRYFKMVYPKWDKKWRVVIFDIPEELRSARKRLRGRLKHFGFFQLQKSVFVFPYPCEKELADICKSLKISNYVDILVAESPGFQEDEIKKFFDL